MPDSMLGTAVGGGVDERHQAFFPSDLLPRTLRGQLVPGEPTWISQVGDTGHLSAGGASS